MYPEGLPQARLTLEVGEGCEPGLGCRGGREHRLSSGGLPSEVSGVSFQPGSLRWLDRGTGREACSLEEELTASPRLL